jgi:probable rRNA maturation factor
MNAKRGTHKPKLVLSVQYALSSGGLPTRTHVRKWALAALKRDAEITVRFVGEEEGSTLNRDYRGKDYATNVLTFVYEDGEPLAGDIVLAVPVVAREAAEQHKTLDEHYAHLLVHGVLHLQGYDHETDADAQVMEGLEKEVMQGLGYKDPYAGEER